MIAEKINPLLDERWEQFVTAHPASSVFHTRPWLRALHNTYGYRPVAFATTSHANDEISGAIVCCIVDSWMTGRRLVSVPFADHCDCLVTNPQETRGLLRDVTSQSTRMGCSYVELRSRQPWPADDTNSGLVPTQQFCFHSLDLSPHADALFSNMHKDCIQRKIRRAQREELVYESGRSSELLESFYRLLILTRRRHELPPQPLQWFQYLKREFRDDLIIRLASCGGRPVAAILTLTHKDVLTYKYGCSDESFNSLGGMPYLLWNMIREAKEAGFTSVDLGRSDIDNPGLITFKNRLGATPSSLTYWRYSKSQNIEVHVPTPRAVMRKVLARLPDPLLVACGKLLYRHIG